MLLVTLELIREERLKQLKTATHSDETMQALKKGWPDTRKELPDQVTPYFSYRGELTLHDGLIFKGEIVVPESMRKPLKEGRACSGVPVNVYFGLACRPR